MSNARQGWNAAQLASERPLSGRKSHAPVGTPVVIDWGGGTVDVVHKCCGYHVCSCPEAALVPEPIRRGVHVPYFGWTRPAEPATQLRKMKDEVGCNAPKLCCCDTCWAKLAPSTPSLLTYDQAVAACRDGAVLQITGGVQADAGEWIGSHIRFNSASKRFESDLGGLWYNCSLENNGVQFRILP